MATSPNSSTSRRRSHRSYLDTKDCGRFNREESSTWVSPASKRAVTSNSHSFLWALLANLPDPWGGSIRPMFGYSPAGLSIDCFNSKHPSLRVVTNRRLLTGTRSSAYSAKLASGASASSVSAHMILCSTSASSPPHPQHASLAHSPTRCYV